LYETYFYLFLNFPVVGSFIQETPRGSKSNGSVTLTITPTFLDEVLDDGLPIVDGSPVEQRHILRVSLLHVESTLDNLLQLGY
jgi:hypothetical protein